MIEIAKWHQLAVGLLGYINERIFKNTTLSLEVFF